MRIAILGHTAEPGGAELTLVRMLAALPADGPEVICLFFEDGDIVEQVRALGVRADVLPMNPSARSTSRTAMRHATLELGTRMASLGLFAVKVARWLRANDIDLVHTNTLKADLVGAVAAPLAGKPLVWQVHDRIATDYMPRPAVRLFTTLAAHSPRRVVANSWATAATMPRARGVAVAYPGYAAEMVREEPRPTPSGPPVIGLVGRISSTKGQLEFVAAAARVLERYPDAVFRIIGAPNFGAEADEARVRQLIAERGLGEQVLMAGYTPDTRAEIDAMTVCVHASPVPEPFGNVIVEAMIRGVPIVATNAGGVKEILDPIPGEEPLGLLVTPGDVEELATAIIEMLDHPAEATQRAARAHRSASSRFPAWRTAEVLLDVWQDVAGVWSDVIEELTAQHWSDRFSPASLSFTDAGYRAQSNVGFVVENDGTPDVRVLVAHLPDGPILELRESAALTWLAATGYPAQSWVDILAAVVGAPREVVAGDAIPFINDLVAQGYLAETGQLHRGNLNGAVPS